MLDVKIHHSKFRKRLNKLLLLSEKNMTATTNKPQNIWNTVQVEMSGHDVQHEFGENRAQYMNTNISKQLWALCWSADLCVGSHILTFMLGSLLGNTEQTLQCWDFTDISKTSIYFCLELLSESVWALGLAERWGGRSMTPSWDVTFRKNVSYHENTPLPHNFYHLELKQWLN